MRCSGKLLWVRTELKNGGKGQGLINFFEVTLSPGSPFHSHSCVRMKLLILSAILAAVAGLAGALVVALYVHKRNAAGAIKLIGETARVDTQLDPEGTVIVCGQVWRAKSKTGDVILAGARVRVVAFVDYLALVEVC